jgi:hypothetical protein
MFITKNAYEFSLFTVCGEGGKREREEKSGCTLESLITTLTYISIEHTARLCVSGFC